MDIKGLLLVAVFWFIVFPLVLTGTMVGLAFGFDFVTGGLLTDIFTANGWNILHGVRYAPWTVISLGSILLCWAIALFRILIGRV